MRDEALSPVVAVMLILAIVVTFFALFNATVVPAMKEQAEMEHLEEVKEAFQRFDSDVALALALWRDTTLKERIPLGGGDVLVNRVRSGGTLRVEGLPAYLSISWGDGENHAAGMARISYQPVSNFWQDQGYVWEYGCLNVTRHGGRVTVPLEYSRLDEVPFGQFAGSMVTLLPGGGNCTLGFVNFTPGNPSFTSGNGPARLELKTTIHRYDAAGSINFTPLEGSGAPDAFGEGVRHLLRRLDCAPCGNIRSCTYDEDTGVLEIALENGGMRVEELRIAVSTA